MLYSLSCYLICEYSCVVEYLYIEINRVKSLSKSGNSKKDQAGSSQTTNKESSSANTLVSSDVDDTYEQQQETKVMDTGKRGPQRSYNPASDFEKQPPSSSSSYSFNSRDDSGVDKERVDVKNTYSGFNNQKLYSMPNSIDTEETAQKVSPPRRKGYREEKSEKDISWNKKDYGNEKSEKFGWLKRDSNNTDIPTVGNKQQGSSIPNASYMASKQSEPEKLHDENVNELLEVSSQFMMILTKFVCNCMLFKYKFKGNYCFVGRRSSNCSPQERD